MKTIMYKNRKIICPILAFIIPIAIMLAVSIASGFYPFGKYSILMADMRYQFVDYFGYMKQIFFSDDTYFYSFSKTFGGDMAGLAAYYCNTPFLIFLLFVPNDLLPGGILIMMTVMLGFIGLSFNIFLTEIYGSRYTTLIFSTAYAFMGYLMGYFNCTQYFFNIMMLPLVMLGVYRIVKNERISILYITAQALSIFSSYYIGYMICIFSICFFIYIYFTINNEIKGIRDIRTHLKSVYIYIGTSVVGVFLSAVSLFCAVISLRGQSSRKHIPLSLKGNFNITEVFSGLYSTAFHGNVSDGLPLIYSGTIALVFIILFYLNKSVTKKEKIISGLVFVFLILGFYVDILNVMWHGFSYPIGFPYRNSFLFSFFVLFLSYKVFINIRKIRLTELLTVLCIYVIYSIYMCVIYNENAGIREVIITGVYLIITFALICMYNNKDKLIYYIMPAFMVLAVIDAAYNAYVSLNAYFPDKEEDSSITIEAFRDFVDETSAIVDHINKEDNSFYRIEKLYRRSNNDAMLIGYNGLSHFSSCETQQAMNFLGSLGFRDNGNWAFYGEGSTTFADCFMGMKYMLSQYDETPKPYEKYFSYNDKTVFYNPYALPLCFTMEQDAQNLTPDGYDHFSYQNAIARSMGYKDKEIYTKVENVNISLHNLTEEGDTYTVTDDSLDAYIEYSFDNLRDDFIYMFFDADDLQDTHIVVNGLEKQPYFTTYGWSIRELGHYPVGEHVELRLYADQDKITVKNYEFYYEDKAALSDWFDTVTADKCEINKITSSHLTGKVNTNTVAADNKLLVFSFPYEEEWKVLIDGNRTDVKKALNGLLAVDISAGEHDIELEYTPKGMIIGVPVSMFFIIVLLILIIKKKNRE
jgi:uncharacterized membrane protein YfhO